jgi:hypothetical protein
MGINDLLWGSDFFSLVLLIIFLTWVIYSAGRGK